MLKTFVVASLLSVSLSAKTLSCEVTELSEGKTTKQTLVAKPAEGDSHGGLLTFKGKTFPEISGFISLLSNEGRDFAVLSIYSEKIGSNSSGQYQMVANEQYAQLQFVVPSESQDLKAIEILCQYYL